MAFTQTAASNLSDVITQVIAYGVANAGFTNLSPVTLPAFNLSSVGGETMYRTQVGGVMFGFIVKSTGASLTPHSIVGFASDTVVSVYPTNSTTPTRLNSAPADNSTFSAWNFPGPYLGLYMFTDGSCVHAVVELSSGIFNHMSIGRITKTDTFTGGEYLTMGAYQAQTEVYNPTTLTFSPILYDATSGYGNIPWLGCGISGQLSTSPQGSSSSKDYIRYVQPGTAYSEGGRNFAPFGRVELLQRASGSTYGSFIDVLLRDTPNTATQRAVMFPQQIYTLDVASGTYNLSGYVPNVRVVSIEGLAPKDIIYNDWQIFPITTKSPTSMYAAGSGNRALAYKRA